MSTGRKNSSASQHANSYDNTAQLGVMVVKPEIPAFNHHDEHEASEYVEVEEEPGNEPTEEWEKDIPPFLRKLSTMVNENRDAFVWKNDGSLIVKDPDFLSSHLLPTYFQAIKACSFVRQLNMYGFHKIDDPTGQNPKHYEFRHPCFVPGHRELLKKIERRKTSKRNTSKNDEEPPRSKAAAAKLPVPAPDPSSAQANQSILDAVNKLAKQTQDNQNALLQVLGELKSYRQSHNDLEHKLNQYISQNPGNGSGYHQPQYTSGPPPNANYKQAPHPNRPIVQVRRPNPNAPRPTLPPPNGNPNGYGHPNPPMQQQRSAPPQNAPRSVMPVQQHNYPPQQQQQQHYQPEYATGMAVYASAPEPVHPLDHSGQYIQQYDDSHYQNDQNYPSQPTNGYSTRHSGSYAPVDEHSVPNTPINQSPYQQADYHSPAGYNSSSPYTPVHSNDSTPSPPVAYTGGEYHGNNTDDHTNGSTDPSSIPPQYYDAINFNNSHANEQLDEFVLLNLGLGEENHSSFSEYMNNELIQQGSNPSNTSDDAYAHNSQPAQPVAAVSNN